MTSPTLLNRLHHTADELACRFSNGKVELLTQIGKIVLPRGCWGHSQAQSHVEPTVYLTFDDGPDPHTTPALLELLDEQDLKATFFLVGKNCRKHPELVKRIHEAGHTLGNHTFHHLWLPGLPTGMINAEIVGTNQVIEDITGVTPHAFRPPFGVMDHRAARCLKENDMTPVYWGSAPEDLSTPGSHRVVRRVMWKIADGSLIVLHEGKHLAEQTIEAAGEIIARTRSLGYQFSKVKVRA